MNKLLLLWLLLFTIHSRAASLEETAKITSDVGIQELEKDRLYVGKVADDFYLAMERVTDESAKRWKAYAVDQYHKIRQHSVMPLKYLPTTCGCTHFEKVLNSANILTNHNELWVAFASNKEVVKGKDYISDENIEMYVSVLIPRTTPITAHMGISRTREAAVALEKRERKKHPDQSIHLHSFAAKVSKLRDPKKVFMLTAPVPAMQAILIDKMPLGSVFVGDSDYQKQVELHEKNPETFLSEYDLEPQEHETETERKARLEKVMARRARSFEIASKVSLLKTHPPRIHCADKKLTIVNADGSPLVTLDNSDLLSADYWVFMRVYETG